MNGRLTLAVLVFVSAASAATASAGQFILRAKAGVAVTDLTNRYGMQVLRTIDGHPHDIYLIQTPVGTDDAQWLAEVVVDPEVENCEAVQQVVAPETLAGSTLSTSTAGLAQALSDRSTVSFYGDTAWVGYVNQPAATLIGLPSTRAIATGLATMTVAIIDTGVDPNHPLLKHVLVPGYDFTRNLAGPASELLDLNPQMATAVNHADTFGTAQPAIVNLSTAAILDLSTAAILDGGGLPAAFGHGTMVAGVVHLTAPTVKIMPLKAFSADGTSDSFSIVRAIYYAVENGAKVINMSFSQTGLSEELMHAINFATDSGVTCVASAGNTGQQAPLVYPAAFRTVMGVGSSSNTDTRSTFSNFGSSLVHLAAPGEGIVTTYPGGRYAAAWGTSFSAPFVSGGAALLIQLNPTGGPYDGPGTLGETARPLAQMGYGRIDIFSAVSKRSGGDSSGSGKGGGGHH
jgi:subtilisin family serine protease